MHPISRWLLSTLPLDSNAPPRLASASLEALGELALATGIALKPSVHQIIPHVLEIMQDQSSASKQRTSLRTLGQIAGSTGYVISPYLEYPSLLSQATDILPATKRAPWSLRREVIRTLGILGALDPDRYHAVASRTSKRGAVGGAYFEEIDHGENSEENQVSKHNELSRKRSATNNVSGVHNSADEDKPAYLYMYEQYAMVAQPVSNLRPPRRMTPADDEFYPTVAILALMRIFREPALTVHYGTVAQAIMFIFQSLGLGCVPYLKTVVPHVTNTLRICSSKLRESLLKQLATLSLIVREHLRSYVADIFEVAEEFWNNHLATIFVLVSNIATAVPDEFKKFAPNLIRRLLGALDESNVADWTRASNPDRRMIEDHSQKLSLVLSNLSSLRFVLNEYLHVLVPALLRLADSLASISASGDASLSKKKQADLSVLVYLTLSNLLSTLEVPSNPASIAYFGQSSAKRKSVSEHGLPSRVIHPLIRILKEKPPADISVGKAMVETICICAKLIGHPDFLSVYGIVVRETIQDWEAFISASNVRDIRMYQQSPLSTYDAVLDGMLGAAASPSVTFGLEARRVSQIGFVQSNNNLMQTGETEVSYEQPVAPQLSSRESVTSTKKVNQANLQRAWDVSQRSSMDDWDEWMRRLAIELLRQAPSQALRACASLAQAYQPLARELFSAAFACCWDGLSDSYRENLVGALQKAFVSNVSPEILQALLNLAEFMEHDPSGGLPIEISVLANLALKCRSYAKALQYMERDYRLAPSNASVEALISINRKLDLQDAALGILKVSSLGDAILSDVQIGDELSTKFARHHAYEMCYSVMWNQEGAHQTQLGPGDITAKQELWLAKLGSWQEALAVYEQKLDRDPEDFEAMLGCMRCQTAGGEWKRVLEIAENNWQNLSLFATTEENKVQDHTSPKSQKKAIRMCAHAAWRLGNWDDLEKYSAELVRGASGATTEFSAPSSAALDPTEMTVDYEGAFYNAISYVHKREWSAAAGAIDAARKAMDGRLTALLAESYSRAYPSMVTAQTLSEMEEIIELRKVEERERRGSHLHAVNKQSYEDSRQRLLSVWKSRLAGCRRDAEVHSSILAVRSLILGPEDDLESILSLSELSRQAQRHKFAEMVLLDPLKSLDADIDGYSFGLSDSLGIEVDLSRLKNSIGSYSSSIDRILQGQLSDIAVQYGPHHENWSRRIVGEAGGFDKLMIQYRLYSAYVKHLWYTDRKDDAMIRMEKLASVIDMVTQCENIAQTELLSTCWVELGEWKIAGIVSPKSFIPEELQVEVLSAFKRATMLKGCGYRAWHAWALLNFRLALQYSDDDNIISNNQRNARVLRNHVVAAINGFVNAISLGTVRWSASVQQDLLNFLTCLFKFGNLQDVALFINQCIGSIAIEAWLGVLPQLLARIHIKHPSIRSVLHPLLERLGEVS